MQGQTKRGYSSMHFAKLGHSDLKVSNICLGSMTWGVQNTQADANAQINLALSAGINFVDTAEMYATPPTPETYGKTETIIGNYFAANPDKRKEIILATKIAGNGLPWIRGGKDITGEAVIASVDASLKRLQTDYIDLYQLHWPNRLSPHFSKHWPGMLTFTEVNATDHKNQMLEILQALGDCVQAGKIRYCGLSDDTPWGINQYLQLAEQHNLPRIVSIQNEFSLLHTKDWPYLVENCVHENIAYLPWSPLAGGLLTGKYLNGARPQGSRFTISQRNGLFRDNDRVNTAVSQLVDIAQSYGITAAQLALAWCAQVDGVTSTIIGATSMEQLKENIQAFELDLSEAMLKDLDTLLRQYPMPF